MIGRCGICSKKTRLVRDHNHKTGNIRGNLCNQCNGRLGAYEAEKRRGPYVKRHAYLRWIARFGNEIEEHLKKDTGVKYKRLPRRKRRSALPAHRDNSPRPETQWDRQRAEARETLRRITDELLA